MKRSWGWLLFAACAADAPPAGPPPVAAPEVAVAVKEERWENLNATRQVHLVLRDDGGRRTAEVRVIKTTSGELPAFTLPLAPDGAGGWTHDDGACRLTFAITADQLVVGGGEGCAKDRRITGTFSRR